MQLGPQQSRPRPKTGQRSASTGSVKPKSKLPHQQQYQQSKVKTSHVNSKSADGCSLNISLSMDSGSSPRNPTNSMIQQKSQQRLVLEQVSLQYFLNDINSSNGNTKYVGVVDYGEDVGSSENCLGDIEESGPSPSRTPVLGLSVNTGGNANRFALLSFLGGVCGDNDEATNDNSTTSKMSTAE